MSDTQVTEVTESPTVKLGQAAQIIEIMLCIALCCFYTYKRNSGRCGWQVLYVSAVTPIGYILNLALPKEMTELVVNGDQKFYWLRYAGWYLTCPIMLELLCRIVVPRKPSTDMLMKILVIDLLMTTCGITAALQKSMTFKMIMFGISTVCLAYIYYTIYSIWTISNHRKHSISSSQRKYRRNIMLLTFTSWLMFPVLFLLGPETFDIISLDYSIVCHVIGDIISKNIYCFISWHFRNIYIKKKTTDNVEANVKRHSDNEKRHSDNEKRHSDNDDIKSMTTFKTDQTPDFDGDFNTVKKKPSSKKSGASKYFSNTKPSSHRNSTSRTHGHGDTGRPRRNSDYDNRRDDRYYNQYDDGRDHKRPNERAHPSDGRHGNARDGRNGHDRPSNDYDSHQNASRKYRDDISELTDYTTGRDDETVCTEDLYNRE